MNLPAPISPILRYLLNNKLHIKHHNFVSKKNQLITNCHGKKANNHLQPLYYQTLTFIPNSDLCDVNQLIDTFHVKCVYITSFLIHYPIKSHTRTRT